MSIHSIFVLSSSLALLTILVLVHAQNQAGFVSIDCGAPQESKYTEKTTGINYISDSTFTDTGLIHNISSEHSTGTLEQPFQDVRSFPQGTRNCYTLKPGTDTTTKFLIRASFMYGNYDGLNKLPTFGLLLDSSELDSVQFQDASTVVYKEIIHVIKTNHISVCLINTGSGTPFISGLELRPMENDSYVPDQPTASLQLFSRFDVGSTLNQPFVRYKDDAYDRIWTPYTKPNWAVENTSSSINTLDTPYKVPSTVMQTSVMPGNGSKSLVVSWEEIDSRLDYFICLHFADLDKREEKSNNREETVYLNGQLWQSAYDPPYMDAYTIHGQDSVTGQRIELTFNQTDKSLLPPIINGIELYQVKTLTQSLTNPDDVNAMVNIKKNYGVKKDWQGDPCAPVKYLWQGLNCSYADHNPSRIISLNLSSSGISGEISPHISGLTALQALDLSNNSLTGTIPDFLLQLPFLKVINLRENNLKGSVPVGLLEKSRNGLLSLSLEGNPNLCTSESCTKKKSKSINVAVVATVVPVLVIFIAMLVALWIFKKKKQAKYKSLGLSGSFELKSKRFSHPDIVKMTNNFEKIIGRGGFGTVYYGCLNDTQVAVKMLSPSSAQGYKQFQAEVELLMRVHHKNLTSLVGYCEDGTNLGLIYEYMSNGSLDTHLSGNNKVSQILSWEKRLEIAIEAAQGLEYLHSGCKPPIIHRDVKSTNILLNENFQAKLADFGLSRIFPTETGTHALVSTIVGTPGYLDPEYYILNTLTAKSDVYSFGVVLLELITSKSVIEQSKERTHISQWVSSKLAKADVENVVDPSLKGNFDINSVWKAVELAMTCVSSNSVKRPTMNQVVMELNECLAMEMARGDSFELSSFALHTEISPLAR